MSRLYFRINELLNLISGCSFKEAYGLYCPGCGGTRAVIALMEGKVIQSLLLNPLPLLLIVDFIISTATLVYEKKTSQRKKLLIVRIISKIVILLTIIALFIIRNYLLIYKGIDVLGDLS